ESYAPAADMFSVGCLFLDLFFNAQGAFVPNGNASELPLVAAYTGDPKKDDPFWKLDSDGHCFRELEGLAKPKGSQGEWLSLYGTQVYTALRDMINRCLSWNPKERPSAAKLLKDYPTLFDKACTSTSTKSPFANGSKLLPKGMFAWHVLDPKARYPAAEAIHDCLDLAGHIYKRFV